MIRTRFKVAYILSIIVIVLAIIASAGGLLLQDLYRDNLWTTSQWAGNDFVTLVIAVPILSIAMFFSWRGSERARLVWLGMLHYMLYNFAFYLFATAFNQFFLVYVGLFTFSMLALIFSLPHLDVIGISQRFQSRTPVKWISGYMMFVAIGLGGLWIAQSLMFVATGQVPQVIIDSAHPTSVIFAIDLSLLVPFFVLGSISLWRRQPWGYALGVMLNVSGATYTLALAGMGLTADQSVAAGASALVPLWLFLTLASVGASIIMIRNMSSANR